MKLSIKKIKSGSLIFLVLNILFLGIVIYDALIIYNLYKTLNQEQPYESIARIVRINTKELDKAVLRFNSTVNYTLPVDSVADPFSKPGQ